MISAPEIPFHVHAHRLAVFLQQSDCFLRLSLLQKSIGLDHIGVAHQQRIRILLCEVFQSGNGFGAAARLHVRRTQVVGHVFTKITRIRFGADQRINGLGVIVILNMGVRDHQPG